MKAMKPELEEKLRKLASTDWGTFTQIAGEEVLIVFSARLLRKEGKSWNEISLKLGITVMQARTACKKIS